MSEAEESIGDLFRAGSGDPPVSDAEGRDSQDRRDARTSTAVRITASGEQYVHSYAMGVVGGQ
jgi:hypothetical protein